MFPSIETGIHVGIAMAPLYGLLAAASLSVRMAARGVPPSMLSNQVNSWWRIFPIVSIVLLTYPQDVRTMEHEALRTLFERE